MGFYDTIYCEHPLPDGREPDGCGYQTKHLGRGLGYHTLTTDGRLLRHPFRVDRAAPVAAESVTELPIHGDILLTGSSNGENGSDWVARFTHGRLESLRTLGELTDAERNLLMILAGD